MSKKRLLIPLIALIFSAVIHSPRAATQIWDYKLLEGSALMDECLICGRPSFKIPMRGSFRLRVVEAGPFGTEYAIDDVNFTAGDYKVTGSGTYHYSSAFAVTQSATLEADILNNGATVKASFTNESAHLTRIFPMLAFTLKQTNGTLVQTFTLDIAAAPLEEIWFSTVTDFKTTKIPEPDNEVTSGDLLSTAGRIVKYNSDFQENFPGPTFQNMGLDAIDLLPGGEIVFSTGTVGILRDGDFVHLKSGTIVPYEDYITLFASFDFDLGLDAIHFTSPTRFYFSTTTTDVSDPPFGALLWADLETQEGGIERQNADLLALFHLDDTDYGLDAVYQWPSGEIWFSTQLDFNDTVLGPIHHGDLLSDRGYIVYRNADLLSALAPANNPGDLGLDALVIISDATASEAAVKLQASINPSNNSVLLTWSGNARVFQLERARDVTGPWEKITPITTDTQFEDTEITPAAGFYRLRQW